MNPTHISQARDPSEHDRRCACCDRELKGKVAWLELDGIANTYHNPGAVPEERSQGEFVFGLGCTRTALART